MAKNPLLSKIGAKLRESRPLVPDDYHYFNRVEPSKGGNYVEVWFRTLGCRHDYRGGCTMCNYGVSTPVSSRVMLSYVKEALAAIEVPVLELLVSPSGSFLDPWEVPPAVRRGIYRLVEDFSCDAFMIETRAETVHDDCVREMVGAVSKRKLVIEVGLESAEPWILDFCVNKEMDLSEYARALRVIKKFGVTSYANISLGTAFLTEQEAIRDALYTTRWCFQRGTDTAVIFPLHVKPYTLLHWLWEQGMYAPVSLWSLVEVLKQLGSELCARTEISWYKSYYKEDHWISSSPTTCPACIREVTTLLDAYRDSQSYEVVLELDAFDCACHDAWRSNLQAAQRPLFDRVVMAYEHAATLILGKEWWSKNRDRMLAGILSSQAQLPSWELP